MDSSETSLPTPAPTKSESGGSRLLPSLKDTVGSAYSAQRPLQPQPEPSNLVPELFVPGHTVVYLDDLPVLTYTVGGLRYNMVQPKNETKSEFSRKTVDGRILTYELEVVQQPEKARACGSGQKSTQDRRPVDPPPVVRLRMLNGNADITQVYDATFMLYASLEVARPIAAGKMHTPPAIPVLSGVAVASAAYLEKPTPAAYFIFPDLSVRHEGWYRLKFSLFEGVKHQCDADVENPFVRTSPAMGSAETAPVRHEGMANRLEVQTVPFQVYSAKKFPGLSSSTELSKCVSDQGCRVRIRREIRQRKRPQKQEPDMDDGRSSYQGTPQVSYRTMEHSRSVSRNSFGSQGEAEDARRPSVDSMYGRAPIPSRQSSIVSMPGMPMTSPSMRNITPTPSMPPPPPTFNQPLMHRQAPEHPAASAPYLPAPAPKSYPPTIPTISQPPSFMRSITPEQKNALTLPPLQLDRGVGKSFNSTTRRWNLPEPLSTKRTRSPHGYNFSAAMKGGARPDLPPIATPTYSAPLPGANDIIEPDTEADSHEQDYDYEEPVTKNSNYYFTRADGTTGCKPWPSPAPTRAQC
ncbi:hypothetical protein LTR67_002206 [Exophiala xenobiotica]|nr:hypothetical protein LTS06_003016 [Exophiala xenobiotica]KAK5284187.1 hypothetical protein LTR40_000705 [Exophiala xenobiotica]KAK5356904.1 hypothetical protein LTR61_000640 [Exophiala xenobiotica]KAK5377058.1 hypothetical protein LTR11_004723 [Exophiala xenobiotica]KAK5406862.1 hypothetical protein LTR06_008357 [Exophiala xenobiotica]